MTSAIGIAPMTIKRSLLVVIPLIFATSSPAFSQGRRIGDWSNGCSQGYCEYILNTGDAYFNISCDMSATRIGNVDISFSINKKGPAKNSIVTALVGGEEFGLCVDDRGGITTQSHVCADNAIQFIEKLKTASSMKLVMSNGQSTMFKTRGGKEILPDTKTCTGGFYATSDMPSPKLPPKSATPTPTATPSACQKFPNLC